MLCSGTCPAVPRTPSERCAEFAEAVATRLDDPFKPLFSFVVRPRFPSQQASFFYLRLVNPIISFIHSLLFLLRYDIIPRTLFY